MGILNHDYRKSVHNIRYGKQTRRQEHDAAVAERWQVTGRDSYSLDHLEDFIVEYVNTDPDLGQYPSEGLILADQKSALDAFRNMRSVEVIDSDMLLNKDKWDELRKQHDGYMELDLSNGSVEITRDYRNGKLDGEYPDPLGGKPISFDASAELTVDEVKDSWQRNVVYCWYDTLDRQLMNERNKIFELTGPQQDAKQTEQMFTQSKVALEPRSVSGMLKDSKMSTGMPLIAIWKSKDRRFDKDGNMTGCYLDVQLDQSQLTKEDILQGKGFSSPSISFTNEKDPKIGPNQVFYTKRQFDMMNDIGKVARMDDGTMAVSFSANVYSKRNENTGNAKTIVLMPKEVPENASLEDRAVIEGYNQYNQLRRSIHPVFTSIDVKRQFDVTQDIRKNTLVNAKYGKDFDRTVQDEIEDILDSDYGE